MKLYSKTDLERCARLAIRKLSANHVQDAVESAVADAVEVVTDETPEVYRVASRAYAMLADLDATALMGQPKIESAIECVRAVLRPVVR